MHVYECVSVCVKKKCAHSIVELAPPVENNFCVLSVKLPVLPKHLTKPRVVHGPREILHPQRPSLPNWFFRCVCADWPLRDWLCGRRSMPVVDLIIMGRGGGVCSSRRCGGSRGGSGAGMSAGSAARSPLVLVCKCIQIAGQFTPEVSWHSQCKSGVCIAILLGIEMHGVRKNQDVQAHVSA